MMSDDKPRTAELSELEAKLGYKYEDISLLELALTHSSYSNEMKAKGAQYECNERAEFLGDSVLSFVVSGYLFVNYPYLPEGELSRIRAQTVCEKTLSGFSQRLGLGEYLRLGHGEIIMHGDERPSILADAFEALLASIYLDGGIDAAGEFLLPYVIPEIKASVSARDHATDYKTQLQQFVQSERGTQLEYNVSSESGPPHMRVFEVEALLGSNIIGRGSGMSKREAEQNAAKEALRLFGIE